MMRLNFRLPQHPLIIFLIVMAIPIAGALFSELVMFDLPGGEVEQLLAFMTLTGLMSSLLSFAFYRLGILEWFRSLRWAIWMVIALLVLMIFLNVWVIARLTFIQAHYLTLTSVLLVFAGLSALTIGFFASKTMTDRLSKLHEATQALAGRDFAVRLKISGNDEIAQLADTFNDMARNLEEVEEQKRQLEQTRRDLTAWVSHDLRTPLASLRVMIEAMLDGVVDDEATVRRYLDSSRAEVEHLSHLIDDLFELAQLDVGHLKLNMQQASIRDLISDTLGSMTAKADQNGITLVGEVSDDIDMIQMAPDKIQRVLTNLLDNAIKYAESGVSVTLRAWREGDDVRMDIHNSGSFIPQDVLPRLFESFYRGEGSRMRGNDGARGTGLGLAIARGFIEAHDGRIWATSVEADGTTFSFTLPQE
ncbi:MAG: HAMP domain-containing protein [Chloroflexi bacterium]|nr:HAMP domain-containing protein [Chloroflexota bacterium]